MAGRSQTPKDAGERKLVSVLFADLSGFTALSEALDAEEVRALVNDCFDVLVPVIEAYGGVVDKFVGDEVMALFGAPLAHEDDADRALSASCEMMAAFADFAGARGLKLSLHIGIETGTVVTGGLGSHGREEYSVIGDAVNVAARLTDAAEAGQILVGPATQQLAGEGFDFTALPPLQLRGKAAELPVFQLEGERWCPRHLRRSMIFSPLVGREAEMAALREALRGLAGGRGAVVAIAGEAGVGKSRLVSEAAAAAPGGLRWAEGRGQAYGHTLSYGVVSGLLAELYGGRQGSPDAELLRRTVRRVAPDESAFAAIYPYLARLQSIALTALEDERVRHLSAEALAGRMREAFRRLVGELSLVQPLVFVWEDLHWADPSSLGIIEGLLPLAAERPVLMLLLFRPLEGGMDEWYRRAAAAAAGAPRRLDLDLLDAADSELLVANLLQAEGLPEALQRLLVEKAEGNPFFLEELLRSLLDTGLLTIDAGRVTVNADWGQISVPDTVQGVTASRIDALDPDDKRTLQDASVLGRTFQRPVLTDVCRREAAANTLARCGSDRSLAELRRRQFIRRRRQEEYIFHHVVTQEVAYNTLLLARRRVLHELAAQAIEALFADDLEVRAAVLAQHWRAAGREDRALPYFLTAAERARRTFSNSEALELLSAALAAAQTVQPERVATIEESIGELLLLARRDEEARAHFEVALARAPEDDALGRARLLRKLATTYTAMRDERGEEAFARAELALGPQPSGTDQAWWREWVALQEDRMWRLYWSADVPGMNALHARVEHALGVDAGSAQRAAQLRMLLMLELRLTRYHASAKGVVWADELVAAVRQGGDLGELGWALLMGALIHLWAADLDGAAPLFEEALAVNRRTGDVMQELRVLTYMTVLSRRRGETAAAQDAAAASLALATAAHVPEYVGMAHGNLAWLAWREGDRGQAGLEGQEAWEILREIPPYPLLWIPLWPLLAVRLGEGRTDEAVALAAQLLAPSQMALPKDLEEGLAGVVEAWNRGDRAKAGELLRRCVASAEASRWGWL